MNVDPEAWFHRRDLLLTGHFARRGDYRHERPKGSQDWLFFLTTDGAGRLTGGADQQLVRAGDLACYRPHLAQAYHTDPAIGFWTFYWVHVQVPSPWLAWLDWADKRGAAAIALGSAREEVTEAFAAMHDYASGGSPLAEDLALNALERGLLLASRSRMDHGDQPRLDPRVHLAVDLICRNLRQPLSLDQLAHRCRLSTSRLAHLFKAELGCGPAAFQERERMRRAASLLLRTDQGVAQIGSEVGYLDPAYFSTRFRRHHGLSPRQWRRRRIGAG